VPVLVVDVANVMGSRPDGWWRDRAGAATRLMASLVPLVGAEVAEVRIDRIVAVVEGQARTATAPAELEVRLAPADGDTTIVGVAEQVLAGDEIPLVVTADRGLRDRLPTGSRVAGPGWLLALI
jgi:hypothetical protein